MKHTDILVNLRKIIRSVNLESKRIEKEYGVSIPQLLCLGYLNEQASFKASHKEIKEFLQLNASTVTGIINRLEKKNYVARLPSLKDKRIGHITLTAKGAQILRETPEPLHEKLSLKLSQLSTEKLKVLQNAFQVIIDFLNVDELDAAPIIAGTTDFSTTTEE